MKIIIAGGTGFLGRFLSDRFKKEGYRVTIIGRHHADVFWSDQDALINAIEGSDVVINLAGRSVDCRYNEKNKKEILNSRISTTRQIGDAIASCKNPPPLWINSSTATIYRHATDRPMTESHGDIGSGFSVSVAQAWEQAFFSCKSEKTRQVALRMAIVLGSTGGALIPLKRMTLFGLGGKQGSGDQMFSWIHVEDVYRIIRFVMDHSHIEGAVNCSAPNPLTNKEVMKALRKKLGMPVGIPSPSWLLEIGAVLIRTETELILKSRWVLPDRLLQAGYTFQYPTFDEALEEALN